MKKFLTILLVALVAITAVFATPTVKYVGSSFGIVHETKNMVFDVSTDVQLATIDEKVTFDAYVETGLLVPMTKSAAKWNTFAGVGPTFYAEDGNTTVTGVIGAGVSVFNGFDFGFGAKLVVRYLVRDGFGAYLEFGREDSLKTKTGTWSARVGAFYEL